MEAKQLKLTFLLAVLMSMVGAKAFAHDIEVRNADGVTIYYGLINNSTEVEVSYRGSSFSSYSNEYSGVVNIPASVTYNGMTYPVTSIGESAFRGCSGLTSIDIPNSVTSIGDWAFRDCSGLTSVTIPNSVASIGDFAFYKCSSLTSVTIPNSVASIGNWAFDNCSGLTSITIPNSVTSIGGFAFSRCSGLTEINVDENNTAYSSTDGVVFNKSQTELVCYPSGKQGAYIIPNSVTSIGFGAFYNCSGLTSITIPNSVTSIGHNAFDYCTGLTSITIPNSVTSIGSGTFEMCTGLTSVTIGNSVTSIGDWAFNYCDNLTEINVGENNTAYSSIDGVLFNKLQTELVRYPGGKQGAYTIPNSVTSIGSGAFETCTGLTSVTIPNSVTSIGKSAFSGCSSLTSVTIGNSVTSIGDWAFDHCTGLTSVTIPNSVTSIGNYAFYGCYKLTSVTIPNSVTSIGNHAFYGCYKLTSVTIPNSVTSIGSAAFDGCSGLTDIYCHIEEPLTIDSSVFNYVPTNTCTLHVPIGSKVKYQAANYWKDFLNIVEDLPTGIVSIDNSQSTIDNDVWFTLSGVRLNGKPTHNGVYLVKYNNGNIRKVMIK